MFALSVSSKQSKRLLAVVCAALTALAVVSVIAVVRLTDKPPETAVSGGKTISLQTDGNDCGAFFRQLGLDAGEVPVMEKTVRIPGEFDEVYTCYNALQKQAGLDLTPYRGLQAKQLTFELQNAEVRYAVLLIKENRVIGGHLTDGEYGGRLLPLG